MSWQKRYVKYKYWSLRQIAIQHEFETNNEYHLIDNPCKTEANLLYRNLNSYLQTRQSVSVFHISNGFFVPDGEKIIAPNFVDSSWKSEYVDCSECDKKVELSKRLNGYSKSSLSQSQNKIVFKTDFSNLID